MIYKSDNSSSGHHIRVPLEVAESMNEISRLLAKTRAGRKPRAKKRKTKSNLSKNEMLRALTRARDALKTLEDDQAYHEHLMKVQSQEQRDKEEYRELLAVTQDFERKFVPNESVALGKAGLSPVARELIIRQTRNVRTQTVEVLTRGNRPLSKHRNQISEVREELEVLSVDLEKVDSNEPEKKRKIQNKFKRVARFIGGIAIIGADAAFADPVTKDLSVALGGAILGQSIGE